MFQGSARRPFTALRQRLPGLAFLVLICAMLASCYPGDLPTIAEQDVVATVYDINKDFQPLRTWAMPDSILHIRDLDGEGEGENILTRDFDSLILSEVDRQMTNLGYTRLDSNQVKTETPDVVMLLTAFGVQIDQYYVGWGGGGWGYWPCCWGPGWGGWYPPYVGTSTYYKGTVAMNLLSTADADQPEDPDQVPVVWAGVLNGVLENNSSSTQNRLIRGIDQAFQQSEYLRTTAAPQGGTPQ